MCAAKPHLQLKSILILHAIEPWDMAWNPTEICGEVL